MMINGWRVLPVALAVCVASSIGLTGPVEAKKDDAQTGTLKKNKAVELMKYLNPVPEKTYLNKSQDRVIKKKGFKTIAVEGAKPVENKELGYFAIVPYEKIQDKDLVTSLLKNTNVSGVSVILPWRLLEPVEGETNFKPIDDLLALCKEQNKTMILRISTCGIDSSAKSDTPDWVFQDPAARSIIYTGTDGNEHQMPIFWDPAYLAKWSNLINELGEQYDKNPSLHSIGITGGGVLAGTNVLPDFVAAVKQTTGADIVTKPEKAKPSGGADGDKPADEKSTSDADKSSDASTSKSADEASTAKSEDEAGKNLADADKASKKAAESSEKSAEKTAGDSKDKTASSSKATDEAADEKGPGKEAKKEVQRILEKQFGMTQRQLIEHWKYVADLFPKAFSTTRLNFDISPPTPNRKGQDSLDEISDYLVYRYGQRIYLTRQNVVDGKHGFDDYRVLLKFHPDTLTGYRLSQEFPPKELVKMAKNIGEDGISFCEVPIDVITSTDESVQTALKAMHQSMGYQLVSKEVSLPKDLKVGTPLKASFTFFNLGAASALKPSRQLDKDVASSYKVQLELRNSNGKPIARLLHTPETPTNQWSAGKPIAWEEELKTPPQLTPGKYDVYLSLVDTDTHRKLQFLHATGTGAPEAFFEAPVGSIQVTN